LGVTDPSRQEPSSIPKPQNVQKNDELQSSIQEVEEELEEEVEEGEKT
jgi:benzoyl-CoA reductase/2-hydroxyglutaryl-CoA dehydratase subunit BcrC/BadD/HgdB